MRNFNPESEQAGRGGKRGPPGPFAANRRSYCRPGLTIACTVAETVSSCAEGKMAMALRAFNKAFVIGAAHHERAVVFSCNEDCFVSAFVKATGAPGASLDVSVAEHAQPDPAQPRSSLVRYVIDLTDDLNEMVTAVACPTFYDLELRTFGIMEVEIKVSAVTSDGANPVAASIR